jgi:polyisoprenoid-binding protein YceI
MGQSALIFELNDGQVAFTSDAPLELIEAKSTVLRGLINADKRTFAFSIPITTFEGFNGPLQRVHFNENYLESAQFGTATFLGKIIESIDLSQDGDYIIRAKGKLTIHGVERERIIKSSVKVIDGELNISSSFTVLLREHDIDIPRIVFQKIAEEIRVELTGRMKVRGL